MSEFQFKINNIDIPAPTEYNYSIEDLSSQATGRTLDGVMHKDVIAVKDTYVCTWKQLSWEDTATILNAIDGKTEVSFTHADPRVPYQMVTYDFYVGQRGGSTINLKNPSSTFTDLSFSFIRI